MTDAPDWSVLAQAVRDFLDEHGLGTREAARRSGLPASTMDSLLRLPIGKKVGPETRHALVKLGMDHDEVELLAALTAGYEVTSALTPEERELLRTIRRLRPAGRTALRNLLKNLDAV